ncbi:MAG: glutathione peroxidase [Rhodoferax sp.]
MQHRSTLFKHPGLALALWSCLTWAGTAQAADPKPATAPAQPPTAAAPTCPALLRHEFPRLQDDVPQNLCQYTGKVLLVVNTASYCGFTSQYEGLEQLYARYKDRGLVVLGFPSNQFGSQEPGSSKDIADFCFNTYGVKFPMFAKSDVRGNNANALYVELAQATGTTPKWNFYKYVVDRSGKPVDSFSSLTTPNDGKLVRLLEKLLASP